MGIGKVVLAGFYDELQKISAASFGPAPMKSLADVTKSVGKKTLPKPSNIAKAPKMEAPSPEPDFLSSMKTNPPPPITGV